MRRKETEIPFCRSFEQMAGASEGRGVTERASVRKTFPGRALERRGITALEKPRRKEERSSCSSVPVVPVFQLISRHPHFSLISYNYLITN